MSPKNTRRTAPAFAWNKRHHILRVPAVAGGLAFALFAAGCAVPPPATPTPDIQATVMAQVQATLTAAAGMTATAQAIETPPKVSPPRATPTPTPTATPPLHIPTATPSATPTATPVPTATPTPTPTPTPTATPRPPAPVSMGSFRLEQVVFQAEDIPQGLEVTATALEGFKGGAYGPVASHTLEVRGWRWSGDGGFKLTATVEVHDSGGSAARAMTTTVDSYARFTDLRQTHPGKAYGDGALWVRNFSGTLYYLTFRERNVVASLLFSGRAPLLSDAVMERFAGLVDKRILDETALALSEDRPVPKKTVIRSAQGVSTSFTDGSYVIGAELSPGRYVSAETGSVCYWARLSGLSGKTQDMIENGYATQAQAVTLRPEDAVFESRGCGIWTRVG